VRCNAYDIIPAKRYHQAIKRKFQEFQAIQIIDYFCGMKKYDKIIKRIIGIANSKFPDSEIYLYGSQARGDFRKLSDWDLLILLNLKSISFDIETKLMDEFYELELETGEIISPLIYSKTDWIEKHSATPLYENIKKEGNRVK